MDCIGFTDILPFYIWGFLKLRKETISFSIVSVSIILLSQKPARQPMSLPLEYLMEQIAVIPIPSREWKVKKTRETLVYDDRDTARKKTNEK